MREISLKTYKVKDQEGKDIDYPVRDVLLDLLFNPKLGLTARGLLERDILAQKIKDIPEDKILLEEQEYQIVKESFEKIQGFGKNDIELVKRVLNAPQVEVKKK